MAANVPAPVPAPVLDLSVLGKFYPYAVPGAAKGSEEKKMKEAEDYLAQHPYDMVYHNLHMHLSSPIKTNTIIVGKYLISPSGVYLIYFANKNKDSPNVYYYYIKNLIATEEDRMLNIPPQDHISAMPIHWLSTGDAFYIVRTDGEEFRLDFYDALENKKIDSHSLRKLDPVINSEVKEKVDLSIPWKEVMLTERSTAYLDYTSLRKPFCLVSVVGNYLLVIKFIWASHKLTFMGYYAYQLNIGSLKSKLFINSDQTIVIYVEGGKRVKGPILTCDLNLPKSVELLDIVNEQQDPPAANIPFEDFLNAIDAYDSNTAIEINMCYHLVNDNDHYLVTRPEGENVLKIRRFRATVGSLTLEGEYIFPCPHTPGNKDHLRVAIKGNIVAVCSLEAVNVSLLEDVHAQKIAEYKYASFAIKVLPNGQVACVLDCPKLYDEASGETRYFILATGYPDGCGSNNTSTFRRFLERDDADQIHYCKVVSQGRDSCFIATIPNSHDIFLRRVNNAYFSKRKRFEGFGLTQEEIKGPFRLVVDSKDNIIVANVVKNGPNYSLKRRIYSQSSKWKEMSVDISEFFMDEMKNSTNPEITTHCWIDSVIIICKNSNKSTKVCYLTLEEKENSLAIGKQFIFKTSNATFKEMSIVNGHFWHVTFPDTTFNGIEDVSVVCIDLNTPSVIEINNPLKLKESTELKDSSCKTSLLNSLRWIISDDGETLFLQRGQTDKSLIFSKTSKKAMVIMHYRHSCLRYKLLDSDLQPSGSDLGFFAISTMSSDGKYLCISPRNKVDESGGESTSSGTAKSHVTFINLQTMKVTKLDVKNDILREYNYFELTTAAIESSFSVIDIKPVYFCPVLNRTLDTACYYVLTIVETKPAVHDYEEEMGYHRYPTFPCRGVLCVMDASMSSVLMVAGEDVNPKSCVNYYLDHFNKKIEWLDNDLLYKSLPAKIAPAYKILPIQHFIARYKLARLKPEKDEALMSHAIDRLIYSSQRILTNMDGHVYRHVIYTLYLVNDEQLFSQLFTYCNVEVYSILFRFFNLFDMVTQRPCTNSIRGLMKFMQERKIIESNNFSMVNDFKRTLPSIEKNYKDIISSDACKEFITYLLFKPIGHDDDIQLKDEYKSATSVEGVEGGDQLIKLAKDKLMRSTPDKRSSYDFYETGFLLNLSIGSFFSYRFFKIIYSMNPFILQNKYRGIVYYKWDRYFKTVLVYCIIYWLNFILAYIYFGYYPKSAVLLTLILIFTLLLIAFELKCIFSRQKKNRSETIRDFINLKDYFMKMSNAYDMLSLCFTLGIALLVNTYDPYTLTNTPSLVWMRMWVVVLLGGRAITWLRVFRRTRYLITSVMSVFLEMIPFLTILSCFILIFAFMWRMADGLTGDYPSDGQLTFYESIVITLNLVFGNSTDTIDAPITEYTVVKFMIWILGNVTIPLTLLNFLIAVLSGVFEATTVERSLHDLYELIVIMEDFDQFFAGENEVVSIKVTDCTKLVMVLKSDGTEDGSNYKEQINNRLKTLEDKVDQLPDLILEKLFQIFREMVKQNNH